MRPHYLDAYPNVSYNGCKERTSDSHSSKRRFEENYSHVRKLTDERPLGQNIMGENSTYTRRPSDASGDCEKGSFLDS